MLRSLLVRVLATGFVAATAFAAPAPASAAEQAAMADLDLSVAGYPDLVAAGASFAYTIAVTNNGPAAAINAVLLVTVEGATFESLTPAAGWMCQTTTFDGADVLLVRCEVGSLPTADGMGGSVFTLGVKAAPPPSYPGLVLLDAKLDADNSLEENRSALTEVSAGEAFSDGFESP